MSKNKVILSIKNLNKIYHDLNGELLAIENINLDVFDKEFVSIVGPSGCGKSTILSILAGIDKEYSGELLYDDTLSIGYMLQTDSLFPWKTILDNCLVGLEVKKELTEESKAYVIELLKKYGLEEFIDKYPNNLSGGMRQRVALIRTLALKPDILLLDEPLSALDSQTRLSIGNDIFQIIKNEGKTAIMVTHDLGEALSTSDRIVVLTKRPGTVKKNYEVDFNGVNDPKERRKDKMFSKYQAEIWRDLDVNI